MIGASWPASPAYRSPTFTIRDTEYMNSLLMTFSLRPVVRKKLRFIFISSKKSVVRKNDRIRLLLVGTVSDLFRLMTHSRKAKSTTHGGQNHSHMEEKRHP